MKIYIAGGVNGNLGKWFWDNMNLYLAEEGCYVKDKIYWQNQKGEFYKRLNILESFFYIKDWQIPLIHKFKRFMLDSGAFTFMQNKNIKPDFEEYSKKYAQFIVDNKVDLFFEMDIDSIVGLGEVERLRKLIEKKVGKQTIPVWHKSRGKEYFLRLCKEYKYIAIGGMVNKTTVKNKDEYKYLNWFCNEAHKQNCKIHGLGFTKMNLKDYNFDSVDSTAWTYGNRGKFIYEFDGNTMQKHSMNHENNRLKPRETAIHNFMEWVKWSEHLERAFRAGIFLAGYNYKRHILSGNLLET